MTADERRKKILSLINNSSESIRGSQLAAILNVTAETIRKDLIYLDDRNLIRKFHGGAKPIAEFTERSLGLRLNENVVSKRAIAKCALEQMIGAGVVFIDAGSTAYELAKMLSTDTIADQNEQRAIVTNSFAAANELMNSIHTCFFLGGDISNVTQSTSGLWAINALNSIKIDIAFLGSSGFLSHQGPGTKISGDALLKAQVVKNADKTIILADHTKFTSNAIMQFAQWSDIDLLITDSKLDASDLERIEEHVNVLIADSLEAEGFYSDGCPS